MKDYLNYIQREHSAYYGIFWGIIEKDLEVDGKNKSKGELRALRTIRTTLVSYMHSLLERVGEKEYQRLCKIIDDNFLELKRKDNSKEQCIVKKDSLLRIARTAAKHECKGCEKEDFHNCCFWQDMYDAGLMSKGDNGGVCDFQQIKGEEDDDDR